MSRTDPDLTERQEIALRFQSIVERVSVAEIRRRAIASHADHLLDNPIIADAVRNILRYRREHGIGRPGTTLRSIR